MTRPALAALLLCAALLAGCSDAPAAAPPADGAGPAATGEDGRVEMAAPHWDVGRHWVHTWAIGGFEFDVKAIVVANASGAATLATDDLATAAQHEAFFFTDLGTRGADWVLRDGEYSFPWYQFPLHDNKTWTATEQNVDFNLQPVTRTLSFRARLMGGGDGAHFMVEATEGGALRASYDYRPSLGWFSHFVSYGPAAEGAEPQPQITITTKSSGTGFTGTYYTGEGEFLLDHSSHVEAGQAAPPDPQGSFAITQSHTHVLAIPYSYAVGGVHHTELAAPDGQHWEASVVGDPDGAPLHQAGPADGLILVPAVPGTWQVVLAGAGAFVAGGGCYAWGITLEEGTL